MSSVRGFRSGGQVIKYDYESLDNKPNVSKNNNDVLVVGDTEIKESINSGTSIRLDVSQNTCKIIANHENQGSVPRHNIISSSGEDEIEISTVVSGVSSEVKLSGIKLPTDDSHATNKFYVDSGLNNLNNRLVNLINSYLSENDSSSEVLTAVKVKFEWNPDDNDYIYPSIPGGTGTTSQYPDRTVFNYTINQDYDKVEFLSAYYELVGDSTEYTDVEVSHELGNSNYLISCSVNHYSGQSNGISKFFLVYLVSTNNISVPELNDLRLPYNYSGTISDYDSSSNYSAGSYCYYPDSQSGRLYKCISSTTGTWDSSKWSEVTARDSISEEFSDISSELVNAREGYDGKIYPSVGDSIRSQISDLYSLNGEYVKPVSSLSDYSGYIGTGDGKYKDYSNCKTTVFPVESNKTYLVKSTGNKCIISFGSSSTLSQDYVTYNIINNNSHLNEWNKVENKTNYQYMYVQSYNSSRPSGYSSVCELVLTPEKVEDEISSQTFERVDLSSCEIRTKTSISSSTGAISPGEVEYTSSLISFIPVCKGTVIKKGGLKVYILFYSGADYTTFLSYVPSSADDYTVQDDCFIRLTARNFDEIQAPTVEQMISSIQIIYPDTIKNALKNLKEIITPSLIIENKFIWRDTGKVDTSRYFSATQDILVDSNRDYYFTISHNGMSSSYCAIYALDSNGDYVTSGYDMTGVEDNSVYCYIPLTSNEQTILKVFRFSQEIRKVIIVFNKHRTTYLSLKTVYPQDYISRQEIEESRYQFSDLADKCYITEKSNPVYVNEILSVANSYYNRKDANDQYYMHYDAYNTVLSDNYDGNGGIDCSTFIGLVLRGIPFEDTEYNTEFAPVINNTRDEGSDPGEDDGDDGLNPDEEKIYTYDANPNYDWSINPYDYDSPRYKFGHDDELKPVRTASQLGQWMRMMGRSVWIDKHFANIMPGDIVFYARKSSDGFWITETRYMHISHVAIVVSKEGAPPDATWDTIKYPYKHTVCEVRGTPGACSYSVIEDPSNNGPYKNGADTLVLVCRPDLGRITPVSGGGSIVVDSALSTSSVNPVQNRVVTAAINTKSNAVSVSTVSGAMPIITPVNNTVYECGELTSLTISSFQATGKFWIWFISGSTPTTVTGINNGDGTAFQPEANKKYKITVENGYATFDVWTVVSGGGE